MYILLAIIAFGVLVAIHELGHFAAAKAFNVKVVEFSIGMGPRLVKKQKGETLYSLRALPFGGACVMEGEDEEVADPRSFSAQKPWKRFIILFAGSFMNFVLGAVVVFLLVMKLNGGFVGTTITDLTDDFPSFAGGRLEVGDTIIAINGERLYYSEDFSTFMSLYGSRPVDITVLRNGEKITFEDAPLYAARLPKTGRRSCATALPSTSSSRRLPPRRALRLPDDELRPAHPHQPGQLISGQAGIRDLSGPVGLSQPSTKWGRARS